MCPIILHRKQNSRSRFYFRPIQISLLFTLERKIPRQSGAVKCWTHSRFHSSTSKSLPHTIRDFGKVHIHNVNMYTICYCTSLGFPRVTIPYTRLGLYIFLYLYMIIQNTQYTDYSLRFSVLPSLKLTWYQSQINLLAL